ncbi:glycosyltransferase [Dellaglioa algida]|uniref:Glycosyl transferase, group 2 family protein n=2 Tax=Dellaglioa algida TaxID=105612 RepID=A0A0R1HJ53_9LACO|nr:glycosyltransferase [Dellaglioa algida]KRK45513.1 glycosyl transferase, group 2 family protein [Dellaglioa algida DSM 15638]MDK1732056.1 glycosyltransferase [Dellaglioa algida]
MAVYNGEKYIFDQLNSILIQLNGNDEIIISDDGSNDKTKEIVKSFKDKRIKLVDGPHKGVIKNFENAIKTSENEIIIFSDQDDLWELKRVEKIRQAMNYSDVVITDYKNIYSNGNGFIEHVEWRSGFLSNLKKNTYIGAMMSVRREWLFEIMPFPGHVPMHDWWIGLMTELKHKEVTFIKEPLVNYRRHGDNLTGTKKNTFLKKVIMRVIIGAQIMFRVLISNVH